MNRDNSPSAVAHGLPYAFGVDVKSVRLDIYEDRGRANPRDRRGGGDKRYCGDDHLIPFSDSESFERHLDADRPIGRAYAKAAMLELGEIPLEPRDERMLPSPARGLKNFVEKFTFARAGNRPCGDCHTDRIENVSIHQERREELEKHEFMMGVPRGRLAVTLDVLTDALVLVGQHGVYCQSARQPGKPAMDVQIIAKSINDAKELISSVMTELKVAKTD